MPANHRIKTRQKIQARNVVQLLLARFDDFPADAFQTDVDDFSEIRIGVLPLEEAILEGGKVTKRKHPFDRAKGV